MATKTANDLKWELRELQKKLKKLGVAPPPPKGKPARADIMKPGKFYAHPPSLEALQRYFAEFTALHEAQGRKWTPEAFLHNVLAAAMRRAPEGERLSRPPPSSWPAMTPRRESRWLRWGARSASTRSTPGRSRTLGTWRRSAT